MKKMSTQGWVYDFESNTMTALKIMEFIDKYIVPWKGNNVDQKKVSIMIAVKESKEQK